MSDRPRKDFPPEPSAPETADFSPDPPQTNEPPTDPPRLSTNTGSSSQADSSTEPLDSSPPKVDTSSLPTDQAPPLRASNSDLHIGPGRMLVGRYRLVRQLGRGGMGVVFLAHDDVLAIDVALKILPAESAADPVAVERFRKEVTLVRSVSHDGVCRVYEFRDDGPVPFFTMELITGRNLRQYIRENELPVGKVFELLLEVAKALEQVHAKGVVHRDLKPENVLVRSTGEPVVVDFGLAKRSLADGATTTGIAGTSRYMSPEQHRGEQLDVRTDVFSFGIMAFELLTGKSPFGSGKEAEVISAILRDPPAEFESTELPENVVRALRFFFECSLSKDPKYRYPSAKEMRVALEQVREGIGTKFVDRQISNQPSRTTSISVSRRRWILSLFGLAFAVAVTIRWQNLAPVTKPVLTLMATEKAFLACDPLRPTVVVGVFKNSSGDPTLDAFARSIPDSLRGHLRTSQKLHVVDKVSPFGECATQWLVDGNVQQQGSQIRLSVEVRDAAGTSLVPPNVENGTSDGFDKLLEKAREVLLDDLRRLARMKDRDRRSFVGTKSDAARNKLVKYYRLIGTGAIPRKEDLEVGKGLIDEAISLDSNYVSALVERGYLSVWGIGGGFRPDVLQAGLRELEHAVALSPGNPDVLGMRCRLLRAAIEAEAQPTDEKIDAAMAACTDALAADPESARVRLAIARIHRQRCDNDRVIESLEQAIGLDHSLSDVALQELIGAALKNHQLVLADRRSQELLELEKDRRDWTPAARGAHLLRGAVLLRLSERKPELLTAAKHEFELEIARGNTKPDEHWIEAGAIRGLMNVAEREKGKVSPELSNRLLELEQDALAAIAHDPLTVLLIVASYQYAAPAAAAHWLDRVGHNADFSDLYIKAYLLQDAGRIDDARKIISSLKPTHKWQESCRVWLEKRKRQLP